jgi:hypothetical protein
MTQGREHKISFCDFLRKYTAIPSRFIDLYETFYNIGKDHVFGIDLDHVADFLRIDAGDVDPFREKFKHQFEEHRDYETRIGTRFKIYDRVITKTGTKTKTKNKTKNKRNMKKNVKTVNDKNLIYMISFDTFERLCLQSDTQMGHYMREHYRDFGKFIDYYKQHISDTIIENAKSGRSGYMYIMMVDKDKSLFEIGSGPVGLDTDPRIKFITLVDNPVRVKKCVKIFTKKYKYKLNRLIIGQRDFYKIDIDIMRLVIQGCAEINHSMVEYEERMKKEDQVDVYLVCDYSKDKCNAKSQKYQ